MEPTPPGPPPPPGPPTGSDAPVSPEILRARRPRLRNGGVPGALSVAALALATLALLGVTAAGRVQAAPMAPVTVAVLFLPYLYGAVAVAAFTLWTAVPDRRLPPLVLALVAVIGVYRWGPRWARAAASDGAPVRVMSWNVRRLWGGPGDGGDPLGCVIAGIRAVDPDVVTLLEVSEEELGKIAGQLDLDCAHSAYFAGGGPTTGGLASCAKRGRWTLRSGEGQRFVDTEDWSYVFSEIERDGLVFNLLAVHLYPYRISERDLRRSVSELWEGRTDRVIDLGDRQERAVRAQANQSAALLDRVGKLHDPTIVAGDFNSTRDTALHVALRGHLQDTWEQAGHGFGGTIQVFGALPLRVDYVYASDAFGVRGATIPAFGCSDHEPVTTELVLPTPGTEGRP